MSWCAFYESIGLKYWCNKVNRDVGWDTYDRYCRHGGGDCPYHSGKEGCFLTTACVQNRNLPDDCMELRVLRAFRDKFLKNQPNGMAEIKEYYKMAPSVVLAINNLPNAADIYNGMYENEILPCVELVIDGKYSEAYEIYKNMVTRLKAKYLN